LTIEKGITNSDLDHLVKWPHHSNPIPP